MSNIFEQTPVRQDNSYELHGGLDSPCCRVRFTGPFQGNIIIWDATLMTLAYYMDSLAVKGEPLSAVRQFIDVGETTPNGRQITVALNVPRIDDPTIIKTMIMVRQYKRLAPGRHEYGEPHTR